MATGRSGSGFAAIITCIVSLVTVFIVAKSGQNKERIEKSRTLSERRER